MAIDDGRVVSNFIIQSLNDLPITIYGDGTQIRSFCYVDDLIEGLVRLFFTENINQPVNLGNPTPTNMNQLATEIIELTKSKSRIIFHDLPSDDPLTREPDIGRAQELLDWNPKIDRRNGLLKTIEYFRSVM